MLTFSPFVGREHIGEIDSSDVESLVGRVAEGYVVEYKESLPANPKIAHSLASFANTLGGWYIVGVQADENNVACAIPGLSPEDSAATISRIRDVASTRVQPTPVFESHMVLMTGGRTVLLVHVPSDQDVPFICDDGRVYRRNGETSEPFVEKDRRSFDELVSRGRSAGSLLAEFASRRRSSSILKEAARVELFLAPYPPGIVVDWDALEEATVDRVKEALVHQSLLLPDNDVPSVFMNIDSAETSVRWRSNSVVLRLANPSDPFAEVLEVEWTAGYYFRFDAPARMLGSLGHGPPLDGLDLERFRPEVAGALSAVRSVGQGAYDHDRLNQIQLLDGRDLMLLFIAFVETFRKVVGERLWTGKALEAVRASGLPDGIGVVVDSDEWASHVVKHGLPLADFPTEIEAERVAISDVEATSWLGAAGKAGLYLGFGQHGAASIFSACLVDAMGSDAPDRRVNA